MPGSALLAAAQTSQDDQYQDQNQYQDQSQYQDQNQALPSDDQPSSDYNQQAAPPAPDDTQSAAGPVNDPPARAARLQYMTGSVSVQPQGTGDWVAGELNRPLTNSDNVWADKDSRAEISVGTGVIRIGSETSLTLTDIAENVTQLQLHQGALNLHVERLYDNEKYEVDTPNQAFTVDKPGDYRFDVDPNADTTVVTVWRGAGESTGDGPSVRIREGQQARFSNGTSMTVDLHAAPAMDSFDEWARSRDEHLDHSASSRYVSPDVVGYQDLDEYGVWKETPDYGEVWYPSVAPGWAPYYYGHWIWDDPWGWTWVDYEPWGFAPFHYGRWVWWGGGWGWAPGPIFARPFYAPALVAWYGGGWGGFGFGFGFGFGGGFGWCPLGFGEPFIPWYGVSRGYFNSVNITNTRFTNINITNIYNNNFSNGRFTARNGFQMHYANLHRPGGFTAVSRNTMMNSLSVARNNIRVSPQQMGRMTPVHSFSNIRPTRASIMGSSGARAKVPPQRAFARPVVSRLPAPNRGSFSAAARANNGFARPAQAGVQHGAQAGMQRGAAMQRPAQAGAQRGAAMQRPAQAGVQRPAFSANRGPGFNNSRVPQAGAMGSRSVPRPPAATFGARVSANAGNREVAAGANGRFNAPMAARNNVPRPPSAMGHSMPSQSREPSPSYSPRGGNSAPRPGPSYSPRPENAAPRPSPGPSSRPAPRSEMNVPRPAMAGNRGYSAPARESVSPRSVPRPSSSYSGQSRSAEPYSRPSANYGAGSRGYSRPMPSYSPSYGRPSYGGGSYNRPAPSYGGGYGGGFGGSRPSYGGGHSAYSGGGRPSGGFGGGGRSGGFGGGGHMSSGGGGHFGGGGGGGHVSGGGGGGGHSSGGGHGGRH
jgi:hypothetical protein